MGFSKKSQLDGGLDSDGKKWIIAGVSLRAPLKPVKTKLRTPEIAVEVEEDCYNNEEEECSTTPTAKEAKIPEIIECPPAPRKRRPVMKRRSKAVKEFFTVPLDLETVFISRH